MLFRSVKDAVPYFRCRACRFTFARPAENPNRKEILDDFEPAYLQYLQPDKADIVNFQALYRWMADFGPLDKRGLIDLGCGSGKLVRFLRSRQVEAVGLEPCNALYNHFLKEEPCFFHGELGQDSEATTRTYDVVTAFDVLEHVEDPVFFLERSSRLLNKSGLLFLSTPDLGSMAAKCLGRRWHFFCPYHLVYFDRETLTKLASRLGLEMVHFSRRGRYRSVGYTLRYLFEFLLRRKAPSLINKFDNMVVPVNLRDTMYCCLRKAS